MKIYKKFEWIMWISFVIAIFLQKIPISTHLYFIRPSFLNLLLIYWIISVPYRINILISFIIGLVSDLIFSPILGIQTFSISILSYFLKLNLQLFSHKALLVQSIIIMIISFSIQASVSLLILLIVHRSIDLKIFFCSIIDGLLWPFVFFFMNFIRKKFYIE